MAGAHAAHACARKRASLGHARDKSVTKHALRDRAVSADQALLADLMDLVAQARGILELQILRMQPMAPFATFHDNGTGADDLHAKQLLAYAGATNGGVLADGGTPASDLAFALDNIYKHPNVAPFISKQLIQRLVTSNPSPAYVQRVAGVFNTNRASATQLREVVKAVLLDPEARFGQYSLDTYGKLREPLLALTHFWRAMDARHACGLDNYNNPYRYAGYTTAWGTSDDQYGSGVAQAPVNAPSVFNFFKPSYLPPGEMTTRSLRGPEFQLQTDSVIANTVNSVEGRAFYFDISNPCNGDDIGEVKVNHARDLALAGSGNGGAADPANRLVDAYSKRFMVGRTPEYLGKKIEAYEMKMASLVVLIPCALVVVGTAIAVLAPDGLAGIANPGIHGFSEILYALSSAANNNGSAFGGLSANTPFWNTLLGIAMFLARFPLAIGMLAIAGSLAAKKHVPNSAGTLPTHTPLFVVLLASTVIVIGALTFLPALALGPIAEHLSAFGH